MFKGVPPVARSVPGCQVESWYGLYVPAATPAAVIGRLNSAARNAARAPEFARKIEGEGLAVSAGTPAELESHVQAEERRWSRVVKENGIKPE
ncbi:tripartite tricarboxylate transporter substrate-binding protein [Diaphorobacter ruginosibacter]|uniref:tripartite tricarboxylate transporter substrate-binding protein n=1 Tax=Diaphorobacter ruginosibacter TaxID=1715720 RepID=UPI00334243C5